MPPAHQPEPNAPFVIEPTPEDWLGGVGGIAFAALLSLFMVYRAIHNESALYLLVLPPCALLALWLLEYQVRRRVELTREGVVEHGFRSRRLHRIENLRFVRLSNWPMGRWSVELEFVHGLVYFRGESPGPHPNEVLDAMRRLWPQCLHQIDAAHLPQ